MDRQAFKQRMQNLKSYRENNPGKGYWDWKVEAFVDGGVNDNLIGSYSNHTGTPTMYLPVTKEYEAVPEGFGEIANVHTPEVTITPLKKKNRGKFNALKKRTGKTTEELTHSKNPLTRKRAIFAQNAKKWKHKGRKKK